jgi:hypothetical protein
MTNLKPGKKRLNGWRWLHQPAFDTFLEVA